MKKAARVFTASAVSLSMVAVAAPAGAAQSMVELTSSGQYVSQRLPRDTTDVDLVTQRAGACRFGRTWGYDLSNRDIWVNGGCSGTFRVTTREPVKEAAAPESSNAGAALAAAAAIAGVAILASRGRRDDDSNSQPYYPPSNSPGYRPYEPPNSGYYPPSAGSYPSGEGRRGALHGPNGLCLDMRGDRVQQGTEAILYGCHGRNNQNFTWSPRGELQVAGMCLDVAGGRRDNGSRLIAWPCNGGRNQQWSQSGSTVRGIGSGKCLDGGGGRPAQGSPVVVWDCNNSSGQQWWW